MAALLLATARCLFAVQTTTVQGTVYRADGTVAQGTILVSWPSFTAADGSTIAAGSTSTAIAPDGTVNLALAPNAGANPAGTYYSVVYHMNDGTVQREYWVVPQAATVTIAEMRAKVVPAAVAQQSVSQQYVDALIGGLPSSYLQLRGGTMSGTLNLSADPTSPMQAATKAYVDAHAAAQLPQARTVIAGSGSGGAVALPEKGVTVSGASGSVAWEDDLNAGVYDPRDPRWAGGLNGPTPSAALQAMSNQMACDLAMGKTNHAVARLPQGTFQADQLIIAPGSDWEGVGSAHGGTTLVSQYNNHWMIQAPDSMTVTCSDGNTHTDGNGGTRIAYITLQGCSQGGCTNAPGDTGVYDVGGPYNQGLEMTNTGGAVEYVVANAFGGSGIVVDGLDTKAFHLYGGASGGNLEWYYYGDYKGYGESAASPQVSATTTGTTGSVALTWPAVTNAVGYAVYRGTSAGSANAFYIASTNSFTDTGAPGNGTGEINSAVTNSIGAPGSPTATASSTGGTLAAGVYYYTVTALTGDDWHGSFVVDGTDVQADWVEAYGLQDMPNQFNYHHLADILVSGGMSHFSHLWPQNGQVGIYVPNWGVGVSIDNFRVDLARLEGIVVHGSDVRMVNGSIWNSCMAPQSVQFNGGSQFGFYQIPNSCQQLFTDGQGGSIDFVHFAQAPQFGTTHQTADYFSLNSSVGQVYGAAAQLGGTLRPAVDGFNSDSHTTDTVVHGVTSLGPWLGPEVHGLKNISPSDTTPTTYVQFMHSSYGQTLYVMGGNSNVTLFNGGPTGAIWTCTGQNINLGTVTGYLQFVGTNSYPGFGPSIQMMQVCNTPAYAASSETVSFSATPAFSAGTEVSQITLAGNVTGFTMAAGMDGQGKTLIFCQDATGGRSVTGASNVRGFFTVGATASKCSVQSFHYSAAAAAWLADSPGVTNE